MKIFSKSSPNARSFEFTRKASPLFQDNTIFKASRIKSLLNSKGQDYKKKENILKDLIKSREQVKAKLRAESRLKSIINENLKAHSEWQLNLNRSAQMIQKHVRGYIARRKMKVLKENISKKHAETCIENMHKLIYSMLINPKYFLRPVQIIETHYKNYKNRKRILSIIDLYSKYCYNKKAERFRIFEYLALISAKLKLWQVKEPAVTRMRLEVIKKNLELLKIKNYWTRNKLNASRIIAKARMFKRILNSKKKHERTYSLNFSNFPSPFTFRYSMVSLPIIYDDNLLLGNGNLKRTSKISNRKVKKAPFVRRNIANTPSISKKLPMIKPSRSLGKTQVKSSETRSSFSKNFTNLTMQNLKKLEIITYPSPVAESLGYKSFNFKVWRPIFRQASLKRSATPTISKTSYPQARHLKPGFALLHKNSS